MQINKNDHVKIFKDDNEYSFQFKVSNSFIYLDKIITFDFIKILCEINAKIVQNSAIDILTNETAEVYILLNWLFKDAGMPQTGMQLSLTRHQLSNTIIQFIGVPITEVNKSFFPQTVQLLNINRMEFLFDVADKHNIGISIKANLNETIPTFYENIVMQMGCKLIMNVKQFIETARV